MFQSCGALFGCSSLLFSSLANKQTVETMNHFTAHIHRRSNHRGGNLLMKMIQGPEDDGENVLSVFFYIFFNGILFLQLAFLQVSYIRCRFHVLA